MSRIADALGVTNVLEGSVRRAGNRIRVTAQLIQADDGRHLWSQRYDRELADVFAVQDDIATSIVRELRGRLAPPTPIVRAHTPSVPAYEAYLMAKHHVWNFTPDWYELGMKHYERAIALDSDFALPYVGLAELFHIRASMRGKDAHESAERIRPAIDKALARDPALAEAHAWRGILATTYEYDWAEAERWFQQATSNEPIPPRIRHIIGYSYLRFIGRANDAVDEHRRALEEDPLNLITRVGLVMSLMSANRHDELFEESQRLRELAPNFVPTYSLLAFNVADAQLPVALAFAERLYALAPWSAGSSGLLAGLLRQSGDAQRAAALRQQIGGPDEYGHAVDHALYHLASGDVDEAFDMMTPLVEQRHPFLMMVLIGGPYGRQLRLSPRWPTFARSIGLAG